MLLRIGLENNIGGRSLAWALAHPGCFAYGEDGDEALGNMSGTVREYADWIERHGGKPGFDPGQVEIQLEETWDCFSVDEDFERVEDGYEVNAWFLHDWKPLTPPEIQRGLELLAWSRADLLAAVKGLSEAEMSAAIWSLSCPDWPALAR